MDINEDKINHLKEILPGVFIEGKIDWEKLKVSLWEYIEINNESYVLNWAGNSYASRVFSDTTTATLMQPVSITLSTENREDL